jgi:hypothetical protein
VDGRYVLPHPEEEEIQLSLLDSEITSVNCHLPHKAVAVTKFQTGISFQGVTQIITSMTSDTYMPNSGNWYYAKL